MPHFLPTLVLRRVPADRRHLARAFAPEADDVHATWWELVDVAAAPDVPAAGVALTRTDGNGIAHVVALAALSTPEGDGLPKLLLELVAALRATDAVAVAVRSRRPDVLTQLSSDDVDRDGDHLVVRF
jgi:hypothetical protein